MMEGEKMESYNKEFLKLKCFSPLKILTSLSFEDTLGGFFLFFSILFLPLFLSFFHAPSFEDLGALMILVEKNHFFKNLFSNEMV
jgi:hypothetical protein